MISTAAAHTEQPSTRLYYLDNLKTALTCLVVAHHASQGYTTIDTGWAVQQTNLPEINDRIIGWFLSVNNAFFMALFFMISAYFIPRSLAFKPAPAFLWNRVRKLGLPIVVFTLFIFPVTGFLLYGRGMTFADFLVRRYLPVPGGDINLGHTWFLFVLLFFTGLYILFTKLRRQPKNSGLEPHRQPKNAPCLNNLQILLFALSLTLVTFAVRIFFQPGYWIPLHALEPARILTYLALFGFGILAYEKQWFERLPVSVGVLWGIVSVVVILLAPPIILFLLGGYAIWAKGFTFNSLIVSAWETFLCVGLCVSLPILFRQKFNRTNKLLKLAAKNSFGVYLLHPLIIIPIEAAIINLPLHPMLKFLFTTVIGIALCYLLCCAYSAIKSRLLKITAK
ncbi:acyltransferase family protein [Acetanaerobacterium elongatum]|uniref:Surface polysaccharide O-acyltransferase, integral membrane enzyme n=1 Tax=Acetanaerobacterium elongatum TaxID=258515 RepID=A0A1G9XC22_9FIRM|nr:acyltransferase [Acetanaerobacterium elongatum]SDM93863.1 Surface polysaccharide O-acyltransferase, integral membrane enzyme [Acetanaerobacterium elongatum]